LTPSPPPFPVSSASDADEDIAGRSSKEGSEIVIPTTEVKLICPKRATSAVSSPRETSASAAE
jgi:hypothetical protein